MAIKYATPAFVFKKEDVSEADRVFSLFTKDFGRLEVFAKAVRKIDSKLRAGMEIFSFAEVEFIQGKNKKTLTDAAVLKKYPAIAKDPEKFTIAQEIAGVIMHLIKGQEKDEKIWDLLVEVFGRLDSEKARKLMYYYFFWNFITLLGHGADLEGSEVSPEVVTLLRLITQKEWEALETLTISAATQESFRQISRAHYKRLIESYA